MESFLEFIGVRGGERHLAGTGKWLEIEIMGMRKSLRRDYRARRGLVPNLEEL